MAVKIGKRIARAVDDALLERDRAEIRALDALLSVMKPPRRRRRPNTRRPRTSKR